MPKSLRYCKLQWFSDGAGLCSCSIFFRLRQNTHFACNLQQFSLSLYGTCNFQNMHPNRVATPVRSSQQQCPTARADAGHWSIVCRMCKNFIFLGATYYTSGVLSSPCASKLRLEGKLWVPLATLTKIRIGSCLESGDHQMQPAGNYTSVLTRWVNG